MWYQSVLRAKPDVVFTAVLNWELVVSAQRKVVADSMLRSISPCGHDSRIPRCRDGMDFTGSFSLRGKAGRLVTTAWRQDLSSACKAGSSLENKPVFGVDSD